MTAGPDGAAVQAAIDPGAAGWRRRLELGLDPLDVLRALRGRPGLVGLVGAWCGGGAVVACDPAEVLGPDEDPFAVLDAVAAGETDDDGGAAYVGGGWIGLWGYQLGRRLERLPEPPPRPMPQPDHWLGRYDWVLRQDAEGTWWFESLLPEAPARRVQERLLATLAEGTASEAPCRFGAFRMVPGPDAHRSAVARTIEHIVAGDIFQANLCVRLEAGFAGDPLEAFCRGVQRLRPAYAAFLDTGDRTVVSLSPELFLRRRGREVLTAPIKGTVPLDVDPSVLAASAKDRAENVMIVDLMRNDLGRVCEPGSISVPALARAEARAGVWHLVSDVTGRLRAGVTDGDLLRATFPPGSVTGAPKVRAMEVVGELEATGRELYTGCIGYASPRAGLETSVVIRTLELAGGRAWLGVGGGVVADSTPEAELAECFAKAAPVLAAVGARLADELAAGPPARAAGHGGTDAATRTRTVPSDLPAGPRPEPAAGVFTTVLVRDGTPVLLEAHLDRLVTSAAAVLGRRPDRDGLERRLRAAAQAPGEWRVRLEVGPAGVHALAAPVTGPSGAWRLVPRTVPGGLGGHKWVDRRLLATLSPADAEEHTEVLLVDIDGTVLETARGSLFVVHDDGVHTPRADGRILPGVARAAVLDLLRERGVPVHEHDLTLAGLADAAEVFVTNAVRGVVPVEECAGLARWPVGRTTSWLRAALDDRWRGRVRPPLPRVAVPRGTRLLLVDNYDSFAWNLAQYAEELGAAVTVVRNDAHGADHLVDAFADGTFTHLVISPGPGRPADAGVSTELVRRLGSRFPVLGVCLGHQCISVAYGGRVVRASRPVHGKPALVHHDGCGAWAGLDGPCVAARYHSLVVADLPEELRVTARTADGTVMGIRHRSHPVEGVQVHPESILTPQGHRLLGNFLAGTGSAGPL